LIAVGSWADIELVGSKGRTEALVPLQATMDGASNTSVPTLTAKELARSKRCNMMDHPPDLYLNDKAGHERSVNCHRVSIVKTGRLCNIERPVSASASLLSREASLPREISVGNMAERCSEVCR
jgi:hypothetical protein